MFKSNRLPVLASISLAQIPPCSTARVAGVELTFRPKATITLRSPEPLLFWNSTPAAQKYEVYIDDAKVTEVPAASMPVMHYGAVQPLYGRSSSLVDQGHPRLREMQSVPPLLLSPSILPGNWPAWAIGPFQRYSKKSHSFASRNRLGVGQHAQSRRDFRSGEIPHALPGTRQERWPSKEGYAESLDGVTFTSQSGSDH